VAVRLRIGRRLAAAGRGDARRLDGLDAVEQDAVLGDVEPLVDEVGLVDLEGAAVRAVLVGDRERVVDGIRERGQGDRPTGPGVAFEGFGILVRVLGDHLVHEVRHAREGHAITPLLAT
jgi:hypothetical protein